MCFLTAATYICAVVLQMFACDPLSDFCVLGMSASVFIKLVDSVANGGYRRMFVGTGYVYSNLVFQFSTGADIWIDVLSMLPQLLSPYSQV